MPVFGPQLLLCLGGKPHPRLTHASKPAVCPVVKQADPTQIRSRRKRKHIRAVRRARARVQKISSKRLASQPAPLKHSFPFPHQVIVAMTVLMALYLGMTAYAMVAVKWVLAPTSARGLGFDPVQKLVYTFAAILLSILLQLLCAGKIIERFGYRDACVACAWFATAPYALNGLSGYFLPIAGKSNGGADPAVPVVRNLGDYRGVGQPPL